jgi:hypothetical protein
MLKKRNLEHSGKGRGVEGNWVSKQENRYEIVGEERRGWREGARKKDDSKRGS